MFSSAPRPNTHLVMVSVKPNERKEKERRDARSDCSFIRLFLAFLQGGPTCLLCFLRLLHRRSHAHTKRRGGRLTVAAPCSHVLAQRQTSFIPHLRSCFFWSPPAALPRPPPPALSTVSSKNRQSRVQKPPHTVIAFPLLFITAATHPHHPPPLPYIHT